MADKPPSGPPPGGSGVSSPKSGENFKIPKLTTASAAADDGIKKSPNVVSFSQYRENKSVPGLPQQKQGSRKRTKTKSNKAGKQPGNTGGEPKLDAKKPPVDGAASAASAANKTPKTGKKGVKRTKDSPLGISGLTPKLARTTGEIDRRSTEVDKVAKQLGDTELGPLSEEAEKQVVEDNLVKNKEEVVSQPQSYAQATAKGHKGVLRYVLGLGRKPVSKENFDQLHYRVDVAVVLKHLQGININASLTHWWSWKEGRGLISFANEESAKIVGEIITETTVNSERFQLWKREELQPLRLLRGPRPDFVQSLTKDQLALALLGQNNLPGYFLDIREVYPRTKPGESATKAKPTLSLSCSEELWEALLQRKLKSRKVEIRLATANHIFTLQSRTGKVDDPLTEEESAELSEAQG